MGGNAIKNCQTRRLSRQEHDTYRAELLAGLTRLLPGRRIEGLRSFSTKESFGDIDFLVESSRLDGAFHSALKTEFGSKEVVRNGDVISFEYKESQVDLILTDARNFEFSRQFQDYNDLGNLIRRVAHRMGLRLSTAGLAYKWSNNTHVSDTIGITNDWKVCLETLGYSHERWTQGFETLEDIFWYVTSSPYYDKALYLEEAHSRDARRPVYQLFLQWLETQPATLRPKPKDEEKSSWMPYLFERFPHFKVKYNHLEHVAEQTEKAKQKFNAKCVTAWTGLEGIELGRVMQCLRTSFPNESAMRDWVLTTELAKIQETVECIAGSLATQ